MVTGTTLVRCTDVSKTYEDFDSKLLALNRVTLAVYAGDIVFLCGHNGSGKTTFLRVLAGTEEADPGGTIEVLPDGREEMGRIRDQGEAFGWIPQDVDDVLPDHVRVAELLSLTDGVGLAVLAKAVGRAWVLEWFHGEGRNRLLCELSGGQRRFLAAMVALTKRHTVLLMDEVFTSLDDDTRLCYWAMVQRRVQEWGGAAVIVTHDLSFAYEHATRVVVLRNGAVVLDNSPGRLTLENLAVEAVRRR